MSNPTLEIIDIAGVAGLAHAAGAVVVVDNVFPTPHSQALAAALPGSRLEMLPSGHSVVVEQPGRLAEVLRPFLSQAR